MKYEVKKMEGKGMLSVLKIISSLLIIVVSILYIFAIKLFPSNRLIQIVIGLIILSDIMIFKLLPFIKKNVNKI